MEFISNSVQMTLEFSKKFALHLKAKDVIVLNGDLGAGKTVFAKGIALGLNIKDNITSPTFAIHNSYKGRLILNHFDFYRLNEEEAEVLGLSEFFGQDDSVCVIEWAENIVRLLPKHYTKINISSIDDNTRKFSVLEV